jgi:hypothetical protein
MPLAALSRQILHEFHYIGPICTRTLESMSGSNASRKTYKVRPKIEVMFAYGLSRTTASFAPPKHRKLDS